MYMSKIDHDTEINLMGGAQKVRGHKSNLPVETLGSRPGLHAGRTNSLDMLGISTTIVF